MLPPDVTPTSHLIAYHNPAWQHLAASDRALDPRGSGRGGVVYYFACLEVIIRAQPYTCLGIEWLTQGGSGLLFFMFIRAQPYTCLGIEWRTPDARAGERPTSRRIIEEPERVSIHTVLCRVPAPPGVFLPVTPHSSVRSDADMRLLGSRGSRPSSSVKRAVGKNLGWVCAPRVSPPT